MCNKKAFLATVAVIGVVWLVGVSAYVYSAGSARRGNPHVYLHDVNGPFAKITIHHGKSIRCSLWSGNVDIQNDMIPKIKRYFESRGVELEE